MRFLVNISQNIVDRNELIESYLWRIKEFYNLLGFEFVLTVVFMDNMDMMQLNEYKNIIKTLEYLVKDNNYKFIRIFETTDYNKEIMRIDIDCNTEL